MILPLQLNEVIKEKTQSYIQNGDADVLPEPIIMPQPSEEKKKVVFLLIFYFWTTASHLTQY